MNLRTLITSVVIGAGLAGCGGGASDDESRGTEQARQQIASAVERAPRAAAASVGSGAANTAATAAAAAAPIDPASLATQLFDFAEANFPQFFPSHRPDVATQNWRYRHYPETGTYVIVADGRVYVMGGPLGADVTYVGLAHDLLNPPPNAVAAMTTPATGKTAWNIKTTAQFTLTDTSGMAVAGPFTCSSDAPVEIEVAADCSIVTGRRLGTHTISVAKGSLVGKAAIKVIPQAQPLGTSASADYNLVVTPDGRVLAWGANGSSGVLGQGKRSAELASLSLPTAVKDTSGQHALTGIVAVSAGEEQALALTEDGTVYSWGNNDVLGRDAPSSDLLPGLVRDATGNAPLKRVVAVSIGADNAVALTDDGVVYTWGNYTGQSDRRATFPGVVTALPGPAVAVSAGWNWSAALLADGRVVTWGFNSSNSSGQPAAGGSPVKPGFVADATTGQPISGIVSLSAGYLHGVALTSGGQVFAWGDNDHGQLGQNDTVKARTGAALVKAPGGAGLLSGIRSITAGEHFALALTEAGGVYSWGLSHDGRLGDGANKPVINNSPLPVPVVNLAGIGQLTGIAALAAGDSHALALGTDGSLIGWGDGFYGALGQGGTDTKDSHVPLLIKDETGNGPLSLGPVSNWPNLTRRGVF
jgi:alpha-tubulin suppressor-like RCC1 family protein